jgi:GNAT superfamily N-acetyltransferase
MAGSDRPILEVGDLRPQEVPTAVEVLARGMRDNPLHLAAFGPDPERRVRALRAMFTAMFRVVSAQSPIAARSGGEILGVTGVLPPPRSCRLGPLQRLRILPAMVSRGPATARRVGAWLATWAERDPDEPHSHLGPLAVDAHLQGRGIGSQIMTEYCRRLDAAGQMGYLETDKPQNVTFYERHGFVTVGQAEVIGVSNWFMRREPGG